MLMRQPRDALRFDYCLMLFMLSAPAPRYASLSYNHQMVEHHMSVNKNTVNINIPAIGQ